jgi:hypothetical protein
MRMLLFSVALFLGSSVPASADATSGARKAIEAAYAKQSAAVAKGDVQAYASTFTRDFYGTDLSGKKKETLEQRKLLLRNVSKNSPSIQRNVTIRSFSVKGNTATVVAFEVVDAMPLVTVLPDPRAKQTGAATQKRLKLHAETTTRDIWIKSGSQWLRKRSATLSEKQLLDGKPVRPAQ